MATPIRDTPRDVLSIRVSNEIYADLAVIDTTTVANWGQSSTLVSRCDDYPGGADSDRQDRVALQSWLSDL